MKAHVDAQQADVLYAYLPDKLLSPHFNQWFRQAFAHGHVEGDMTWNGLLSVARGLTHWTLNAKVQDVNLHYHTSWPDLQHVHAKLSIVDQHLKAHITQAQLAGMVIHDIDLDIPKLSRKHSILTIHGNLASNVEQGLPFIDHSPLRRHLTILHQLNLKGPMQLTLNIQVPLSHEKNHTQGQVRLHDATLQLAKWKKASLNESAGSS